MINVGCRAYLELERGLQVQYFREATQDFPTWIVAEIESGIEVGLSAGQWQLLIYGKGNQHRLEISGNSFCPNANAFQLISYLPFQRLYSFLSAA